MTDSDTGERVTPVLDFPSRRGLAVHADRVDYGPGGFSRVHRHPAGAYVYVIDGSVVFGPLLDLLFIVGAGPRRPPPGRGGELVKALAKELGTGPPPMHPAGLAATFRDRSDAGELLHFTGLPITLAVGAEGGQQAGRQDRAGAGEAGEDLPVRVLGEGLGDLGFVLLDGLEDLLRRVVREELAGVGTHDEWFDSSAAAGPMSRGSIQAIPYSAINPRRAKAVPKRALAEANRMSQYREMIKPSPTAGPLTAPITGLRSDGK